MAEKINIEVAYARPDQQVIRTLQISVGATAADAVELSGLLEQFPEIDLNQTKVGIFSKAVPLTQVVRDGDRVEIYRPLIADPKEVRRKRAGQGKETKDPAA